MSDAPPASPDPGLELRDGVPVSTRFDDVYFSREDGLAETVHVFLDGCGMPDAWRGRTGPFTVAETGFGTGLNFLATWDLWRRHRPAGCVLHYLAVEGYPIARDRLGAVLSAFPGLAPLARQLVARYPAAHPGLHRIWFDADRVCLTLAIGEAEAILTETEARVDAWFLDGFAPAKNPAMWSEAVLAEVARLSRPGARLASFTAAGAVRRGLDAVGFTVEKRPGHGRKRDCIAARFTGPPRAPRHAPWETPPPPVDPARVAVIGAGVAGAAMVGALRRRGTEALWLDRHGRVAAEASGNPLGLLMARPTLAAGGGGRISEAAFRHARITAEALGVAVNGDGVLELATAGGDRDRFAALAEAGVLARADAGLVEAAEADAIAGVALGLPAIHHRRAGWVRPRDWVEALAAGVWPRAARVAALDPAPTGWHLRDAAGAPLATADAVVVAAGGATPGLLVRAHLPLQAVRGQLTRVAETAASRRLRASLTFGGYLSPADRGAHVLGATYDRDAFDPTAWPQAVRAGDHRRLLDTLPPAIAALFADAPSPLGGRAAIRAATPDRQPIAGPVSPATALADAYGHLRTDARSLDGGPPPYLAGLFALGGLGSRGLVTAPLLAELCLAQMLGEPWPLERSAAAALHPDRLAIRALKRRRL